ncbi:MAG: CTP synthase [Candidatus Raymondbacteria bacterium RifOxyA12_full_50_37]|uniref:CTP synthase n=1 Tax=Candidatus Raymondbacteria bacterium RIFOXYD12_FULL_49_13 TaxID=1817890 RepID=A0A1F7FBU8_UNCRA|nr:MAG: CTP synthase [Candidatus Raymondbacteria bacterium RifOxyA12_full_50_37]OGJ94322.1 MAG: CTP synthase [Candidatus Raymondbacteria bacterium RIFOXYA2_FULL_49_16]OGJ94504.1 MAG: CTP synthase [Candidatus Raymondbacteria bacterium RifOxyB12_full_50_8]OGJ95264.1 MAG: CTP synthase [Candidatus Raymondbacteria bacterium RIFOXYC2_FULL_50_21]OGK04103.1 MAG: CTP synthase [Candidatus Raymondbacteria bacterium RIFOXYD12_FULL_49_13]OGK05275.1 MAG: CTP synthase [Candidatus Raymondbacteria bacterium Ri
MKQKSSSTPKFIVVTGGVISGLGKGIAAASIARLLSSKLKIVPIKCDGYLNTDPGTMNPIEHGEVFVLDDGGEVDMDFGHYERFIGCTAKFEWNLTMGKVFKRILEKERHGDYLGSTVQFIPHVTNEIKSMFHTIVEKEKADLALIEIGGTVGDLENQFYIEAVRQLKNEVGRDNILFIHLTYVPIPSGVNEQKTKPTQMSVKALNELGIEPDIIIGRCQEYLTQKIKEKISLYCNIDTDEVISGPDTNCVYEIPLIFENEGLVASLHKKLSIYSPPYLKEWRELVERIKKNISEPSRQTTIAICGKYTALEDSYASIIEALTHCGAQLDIKVNLKWVDTDEIEKGTVGPAEALEGIGGVIVPGGFGVRGVEGKITAIRYCRENNIPFLGICYGMQLAVVEYARNKCGIKEAHTAEAEADGKKVKNAVIDLLPEQKKIKDKGATMRLGGHDVIIKKGTLAHRILKADTVRRRFRHRYEVNPQYIQTLEKGGIIFSGCAGDKRIMQIMELEGHPYFVGCQFHPELTSRLEVPDPFFLHLVKNSLTPEKKGN